MSIISANMGEKFRYVSVWLWPHQQSINFTELIQVDDDDDWKDHLVNVQDCIKGGTQGYGYTQDIALYH